LNVCCFDLEMNHGEATSIIQLGYCIGNLHTGEILMKEGIYVKVDEIIDPYITKLTGISQDQVDSGIELKSAYNMMMSDIQKYDCFHQAITWGSGDVPLLKEQLKLPMGEWKLGHKAIDLKIIYQFWRIVNGKDHRSGLSKSLARTGVNFIGRCHDAKWDSYNTFKMALELRNILLEAV
jgi:inhibitor of KinA sporulation pathway (predicted exonuclease)